MAREIQVDMSRESVDLEDLSSRLAHKKVCNINLKRKNKKFVYKVTFKYMNETYTYQISAKTGSILANKTS